ncbi:alanine/glycine:cation symporter family protein [Niallia endozanthoxylica]|nr:alanine/glycine:cation symporter family protein [Niallia endozanthoxylica]
MNYEEVIVALDGYMWALPLILLIFGAATYFSIRFKFIQLRSLKHQIQLLFKDNDSDYGIKPIEAFCTVVAYRVGTANIAGVCVAILWGGPGAIIWMVICSILGAAISYAECALGQVYKIKKDGEYRGGSYYYLERGLRMKHLAKFFALLTIICVPILTVGPHANSIALAFHTTTSVPNWITGLVVGLLLLTVVFGGIKRIGKFSTIVVPIMTGIYLLLTFMIITMNIESVPSVVSTMISSAFGENALYGALFGQAIIWGVKRSVNSSGAGMGEAVPSAAAAEVAHPGATGLVNSMSVFIDVLVCFCTGLIVLMTDTFNVLAKDAVTYLHIGEGSEIMTEMAEKNVAGIPWTQAAANSLIPEFGSIIIAICLLFFAFTTLLSYYYQGETALVYLLDKSSSKVRKSAILVLRLAMPFIFFFFATSTSSASWAIGSIGVGIMVWTNVIVLLIKSPEIIKVQKDYAAQRKAGIEEPVFNPQKLGIQNADVWMEINENKIARSSGDIRQSV